MGLEARGAAKGFTSQGRVGGGEDQGRARELEGVSGEGRVLSGTSGAGKFRDMDRASGEDGNNWLGRIPGGTGSSR